MTAAEIASEGDTRARTVAGDLIHEVSTAHMHTTPTPPGHTVPAR